MTNIQQLVKHPIYFYTEGTIAPFGQGSSIRKFTNLRSYLDLGFDVEVIQFISNEEAQHFDDEKYFPGLKWSKVIVKSLAKKKIDSLAFYAGFPRSMVLNYLFPNRPFIFPEVVKRFKENKNGIHHFEYEMTACAAIGLNKLRSVWSSHDIFSTRIPLLWEMRDQFIKQKVSQRFRNLRLKRLRVAEDWIAKSNDLILSIAAHEHRELRDQRKYKNTELFPMSWPDEEMPIRKRNWFQGGKLEMLHLGSVDGFVGYDSLKFILGEVFPLLPQEVLQKIELNVIGRINKSEYSRTILALAQAYPQVHFLGFVDDIKQYYAGSDLQLVGGLRATGLRTRIIESFVYGVPVLSTKESAKGVIGMVNKKNIFLVDNAESFAQEIVDVVKDPKALSFVSIESRKTYLEMYSRDIAGKQLSEFLENYF